MSTLVIETEFALATSVKVTDDDLILDLSDGRTLSVPLAWYPRLLNGTLQERLNWRLIGGGEGVHWPDLDEDVSVENVLLGRRSGEGQSSFKRWLENRSVSYRPVPEFAYLADGESSSD